MPPRKSRVVTQGEEHSSTNKTPRASGPRARAPKKSAKRALDAFAIASHEFPNEMKMRRGRMGELEQGGVEESSRRKRMREEEQEGDEDDEEDEEGESKRRRRNNGSDLDEGSDSEGNNWTMGNVDEDEDDSDIDSDDAFGDSDEERFEGWVFRGSQSEGKKSKKSKKPKDVGMDGDINLNEDESADGSDDDDDSEGSFGEDGIDLATALDQYESSEDEADKKASKEKKAKKPKKFVSAFDASDSEPSEEDGLDSDGANDFSSSGDEGDSDEDETDKAAALRALISSLPEDEERKARRIDVHESGAPSEFGVMRKVDLASFKSKTTDADKKKSLKLLQDDHKPAKRNDIARKLDAPLPKRQQDKIDRAVASEKTNETLARWTDTVKENRRAEHLSFPLVHKDAGESFGESRLQPTQTAAPANDLESAIQSILQQSGLSNGKDDEEELAKWEVLQTNKLPIEEVARRRALLRKERELLFREEVRAKRVKKIKSKAYRRVHRKERERILQREKDALKADGIDVSDDEREHNDRRRAEERMGSKHRESKWAKGVKESGRAAWDEDARTGVTEMARRNEELRRRIEGKEVREDGDEASDFSDEEEEDSEDDADAVMQKKLARLTQNPFSTDSSKLGSMKFMQTAENARKRQNDEDVERIRKDLAGEESHSDDDENAARAGRKKFTPATDAAKAAYQPTRGEFEERLASDDEENDAVTQGLADRFKKLQAKAAQHNSRPVPGGQNPYLTKAAKDKNPADTTDALWKAQDTSQALQAQPKPKSKSNKSKPTSDDDEDDAEPKVSAPDADGWQTVTYDNDDGSDVENEGMDIDLSSIQQRNLALTAQGFAGDDIEAEFAAEKALQVDEEAAKEITTSIPGWGAWTGANLSKKEKMNKGKKVVTKIDGVVKVENRRDASMAKVIINEKKVKKNSKFLATALPFPFETKEQYERSLRLPKGPEWTTKKTFQDATKPRVLVKQGIIRPMRKPMV